MDWIFNQMDWIETKVDQIKKIRFFFLPLILTGGIFVLKYVVGEMVFIVWMYFMY